MALPEPRDVAGCRRDRAGEGVGRRGGLAGIHTVQGGRLSERYRGGPVGLRREPLSGAAAVRAPLGVTAGSTSGVRTAIGSPDTPCATDGMRDPPAGASHLKSPGTNTIGIRVSAPAVVVTLGIESMRPDGWAPGRRAVLPLGHSQATNCAVTSTRVESYAASPPKHSSVFRVSPCLHASCTRTHGR
jgi:hypothetical protein